MNSRDNACLVPFPSSEETPSVSMEHLSSFATVSGKESFLSATSNPCLNGGDVHLRESCQSGRFRSASSQSTNRSKPEILSDQGHESTQRVQHQGALCWNEGCHRQIETGPMSREGEIDLFCSDHQSSDVIPTRTVHCQFTACFNTPKYGQRKGPLKFCPQHKRAGMYTNRNGQLVLATRDGSAFKDEDETEAVSAAKSTNNFASREEFHCNVTTGDKTTGFRRTSGQLNSREGKSLQPSSNVGLQGFVEPASLGLCCVQDKPTSSATPKYRKMCEVQGCRIQPIYGPSGMSRPRFCSSLKKEGMVGLKNRPCNFPGCSTRPHYGLLGGRPIYCAKHKGANMVHLLKEATIREKMDETGDLGKAIKTTPEPIRSESKRLLSASRSKEGHLRRKVYKKNAPTFQVGDDQELDSRKGADGVSRLPLPRVLQQQRQKNKETGKGGIGRRRKIKSSIPTASSSSTSTGASTSSNESSTEAVASIETGNTGEWGNTSEALSSLPAKTENPRLAETLDMKTSFEMQAFKDIRESAQADATTKGAWRRVRVPSRKALEASGMLKNEGIQWLTKEKKEEEARRMREFRAQRKAAAAAGLRAGQVIEAVTIGPTFGADRANCAEDASKPGLTNMMWRKLSPAEILEVAARKFTTYEIETAHPGGRGEVASGEEKPCGDKRKDGAEDTIADTSQGKCKETVRTPQGTTRVITSKSGTACPQDAILRRECYGNQSNQSRQVIPSSDRKETRQISGWESIDVHASTSGTGEVGEMKLCQFEDCSNRATFGINGTVRYCKLHALFGMHRINVPT